MFSFCLVEGIGRDISGFRSNERIRIGSEKEPRSVDFSLLWATKLTGHVLLLRVSCETSVACKKTGH